MLNPITKKFQFGKHTVTLETGAIARQATAAVMASMDDTSVLVSVVAKKDAKEGQDFFPLTINYQERSYAAGKIPGSFFKREGRPSEEETLIARLIDRPLRPLFPEGFTNEVQVIITVVSVNPEIAPDIISLIGASAALAIAGVPFFSGFVSKDRILGDALLAMLDNKMYAVPAALGFIGAFLTPFYMFRMMFLTFYGKPRDQHIYDHCHGEKLKWNQNVPLLLLALFTFIGEVEVDRYLSSWVLFHDL